MTTATAQIASHLNIAETIIATVEEWAHVLFVRFTIGRPRFVSKKVAGKVEQQVTVGNYTIKVVNKVKLEVNGKTTDFTRFGLIKMGLTDKQIDSVMFDLKQMAGRKHDVYTPPTFADKKAQATSRSSKLNPEWVRFNNLNNEGAEGYNPHPKYI